MALTAVRARAATVAALRALRHPAMAVPARGVMDGFGNLNEREKGEELVHMRREEKLLLMKLRENLRTSRTELKEILGPYAAKLPGDVVEKLLDWKAKKPLYKSGEREGARQYVLSGKESRAA
ncbi:hypothetical protein JKP88DRAFT_352067 [Tribonema minus]|uniref:Uncharacterized protein n=1 Tax=Tribonema minus TaxID=303371 RepID=A0A835ZP46_9STRA|nr:hypothetical protein JKP88DRAFT_352067 [Tribonema minus]